MSKKKPEKPIDPNDLPRNFNIVEEHLDDNLEYGDYFQHSKYWTEKILKISLFFLAGAVLFFTIGTVFFVLKPKPMVYGSQSDNTLHVLSTLSHQQALQAVRSQVSAPNTSASSAEAK